MIVSKRIAYLGINKKQKTFTLKFIKLFMTLKKNTNKWKDSPYLEIEIFDIYKVSTMLKINYDSMESNQNLNSILQQK